MLDLHHILSSSFRFLSSSRCSDVPPGSSLLSLHPARRADFPQADLAAAAHPAVSSTYRTLFFVHHYSLSSSTANLPRSVLLMQKFKEKLVILICSTDLSFQRSLQSRLGHVFPRVLQRNGGLLVRFLRVGCPSCHLTNSIGELKENCAKYIYLWTTIN